MNYQVIAAAQAGKHNDKRESYGDTLIIDPWGTIVGRLPGKKLDIEMIYEVGVDYVLLIQFLFPSSFFFIIACSLS